MQRQAWPLISAARVAVIAVLAPLLELDAAAGEKCPVLVET
jgi:hypothetical protein